MFKKNENIVIHINEENIRIINVLINSSNIVVRSAFEISTPYDSYINGEIKNINIISKCINEILISNNIKTKNVCYTMQNENIIIRNLQLPYIRNKHDIVNIIKNEVSKYWPIDLSNYKVKYEIKSIDKENKKMNVLGVFFPINIINSYISLSKNLKLKPTYLTANSCILNKIVNLKTCNIINDSNFISVDFENNYIDVNIFNFGDLKMYFRIDKNEDYIYKLKKIIGNINFDINDIYYYGNYKDEDIENINHIENINIKILDIKNVISFEGFILSKYINNIGLVLNEN